ncbi:hypothetical protein [Colwellia sp. E2M01]|uniref:hypothetical protein n=1 Tax=Colwellia sp. E2M01 TaxID=2841561 RepID=UPI001C0A4625|nr:hypothetical protein [Colwellia sp. E2M01]MBU2870594.1 hypothetical protein [Colwellia sp. E2M01]
MIFELLKKIDAKHPFASAAAHCYTAREIYIPISTPDTGSTVKSIAEPDIKR